ncbi:MAG TPA: hypothetical protein VLF69_02225 [Candidatus Saccharimonadales bacterium]|nr:hypothetical protein [Candidatus Saccharimonadales bacterium]
MAQDKQQPMMNQNDSTIQGNAGMSEAESDKLRMNSDTEKKLDADKQQM